MRLKYLFTLPICSFSCIACAIGTIHTENTNQRYVFGNINNNNQVHCGNKIIDSNEICDDGNTIGGDGCSGTCDEIESGYVCPYPGSSCQSLNICGDGKVDEDEVCDDQNTNTDDGCDANCQIEEGYTCRDEPSFCFPKGTDPCMNQIHDPDEDGIDCGEFCTQVCPTTPYMSREELNQLASDIITYPSAATLINTAYSACEKYLDGSATIPPRPPQSNAYNQHNDLAEAVRDCGLVFALTNNPIYATALRNILLPYAEYYQTLDYRQCPSVTHDSSKLFCQRLDEALWSIPIGFGYHGLRESGILTAAEKTLIEDGIVKAGPRTSVNWPCTGVANWCVWEASAVTIAGYVTEDQNYIDAGINGEFTKIEASRDGQGLKSLLDNGLLDDGQWVEGTSGYMLYAQNAFLHAIETDFQFGGSLYQYNNQRYKKMFEGPFSLAYPDLTLPAIHDSGRSNLKSWPGYSYGYAAKRYDEEKYLNVVQHINPQLHASLSLYMPVGQFKPIVIDDLPAQQTILLDDIGFGILRKGEGENQAYLLIDFGGHGGVHGHYDKLQLIVYTLGNVIAQDQGTMCGTPCYGHPLHTEWYKSTVSHNTVMVDRQQQATDKGSLISYIDSQDIDLLSVVSTEAYSGVRLERTILLFEYFWFDLFNLQSSAQHDYDWLWHTPRGSLSVLPLPTNSSGAYHNNGGLQYVLKSADLNTDQIVEANFAVDTERKLNLYLLGTENTLVTKAVGGGINDNNEIEDHPMLIFHRHTDQTNFVTVGEFYVNTEVIQSVSDMTIESNFVGIKIVASHEVVYVLVGVGTGANHTATSGSETISINGKYGLIRVQGDQIIAQGNISSFGVQATGINQATLNGDPITISVNGDLVEY